MTVAPERTEAVDNARALRYGRRWVGRRVTRLPRVAKCGRVSNGSQDGGVAVRRSESGVYFSGVQTCASPWACSVCQAKIGQRRAVEIRDGVEHWLTAGNTAHFVTFTIPHARRSDGSVVPLDESFGMVAASFRRFLQGRAWRSLRSSFGIVGQLRSVEATWGTANGWHPHVHALVFTKGTLTDTQRDALYEALWLRWSAVLRRDCALEASPDAFCAEPVTAGEVIGRYLLKLGLEMHRPDLKEGKRPGRMTPFQILDRCADGEAWALHLWWEWERVTKGRRSLTWSRGLRGLLGLDAEAATDEELAAQDQGGEVLYLIDPDTWHRLVSIRGMEARILQHAEAGGTPAIVLLLRTVRQRT